MTEIATTPRFIVIPRTEEHGGHENACFTHYVRDNDLRYVDRGPMVLTDAQWLAENMNTRWG